MFKPAKVVTGRELGVKSRDPGESLASREATAKHWIVKERLIRIALRRGDIKRFLA
jgi:hypothetical protein